MGRSRTRVTIALCPDCDSNIRFHRPLRLGQGVICPECSADLVVSNVNPPELYWAFFDADGDYDDYGMEWG